MSQEGKIDLNKLKAKYRIDDITLVDISKLDSANECRLYFEICISVGLTFMGSVLSNFNFTFCIVSGLFILLSLFFLIRYVVKEKNLKKFNLPEKIIEK